MRRPESSVSQAAKNQLIAANQAARALTLLRQHPVLAAADEATQRRVAGVSTVIDVEPAGMIFRAGAPAQAAYLVTNGAVRLYQRSAEGPAVTVAHVLPASLCGWMELVTATPEEPARYLENAEALKPSTVVEIPAGALLALFDESAAACRAMLRESGGQLFQRAQRELDVMLDVPARLARLLLAYAEIAGTTIPDGVLVRQPLTHELLANGIGVAVKSIARTLKTWHQAGIVGRHKGWILLRDMQALNQACSSTGAALISRSAGSTPGALS